MLVVTRKENEWVKIGDGIYVVVVRTQSNDVRLGFICDEDIPVLRGELTGEKSPTA